MATTNVELANRALAIVGKPVLSATLTEDAAVNALFESTRDEVLTMHTWNFATKRKRLTAAGLLDCSAKTITFVVNAGADTITDSGSGFTGGFEDSDIASISGSGSNNTTYDVATAAAGTLTLETHEVVVAETLTNDADLKIYALNAEGKYKYAKPSGCLRVVAVNDILVTSESEWAREGKYVITTDIDDNDQILIKYITQVTDPTLFDTIFETLFVIKLCSVFSMGIKQDPDDAMKFESMFQRKFYELITLNVNEGNPNKQRKDTGWESAGR